MRHMDARVHGALHLFQRGFSTRRSGSIPAARPASIAVATDRLCVSSAGPEGVDVIGPTCF